MTPETLWKLRKEIMFCSLFVSDYRNSMGIDEHDVCDFFDGYAEYLAELMNYDEEGRGDNHFFDHVDQYDNPDNLYDWYGCFEWDPLPVICEDEEAA